MILATRDLSPIALMQPAERRQVSSLLWSRVDADAEVSAIALAVWRRAIGVDLWSVLEVVRGGEAVVRLQLEYLRISPGIIVGSTLKHSQWEISGRGLLRDGRFAKSRQWAVLRGEWGLRRRHLDGVWRPVPATDSGGDA